MKLLMCFNHLEYLLFLDYCKNKKQFREIVLGSEHLQNIDFCIYNGKKYSISEIYKL